MENVNGHIDVCERTNISTAFTIHSLEKDYKQCVSMSFFWVNKKQISQKKGRFVYPIMSRRLKVRI